MLAITILGAAALAIAVMIAVSKRSATPILGQSPVASRSAPSLATKEWCDKNIVGESHYQAALAHIAEGRDEGFHCTARLKPEPNNPHDRYAVAVFIGRRKVGYLAGYDAKDYVLAQAGAGVSGQAFDCPAYVNGGFLTKGETAMYGVQLGMSWPPRFEGPSA